MTSSDEVPTLNAVVPNRPATSPIATGKKLATVLVFPVPHSDVGLVQGLRGGRVDAVQALCDRHGAELLRVAMRVLGPKISLTEVVGEGVSRAISRLSQLDNARDLRHWLLRHLVEVLRQRLRVARWRSRSWLRGVDSTRLGPVNDPGVSARQLRTYRLLDGLGDTERIVLCLIRLDGMEPFEVATTLGISVARVRGLLERAEIAFERLSAQ